MKCALFRSSAGAAFEIRYGRPGANNARNNSPDWMSKAIIASTDRTLEFLEPLVEERWSGSFPWNIHVNP